MTKKYCYSHEALQTIAFFIDTIELTNNSTIFVGIKLNWYPKPNDNF